MNIGNTKPLTEFAWILYDRYNPPQIPQHYDIALKATGEEIADPFHGQRPSIPANVLFDYFQFGLFVIQHYDRPFINSEVESAATEWEARVKWYQVIRSALERTGS